MPDPASGLARYEHVYAALVDWQHFESGAGVGLANFRHEKSWRPPSVLLEADPPLHDAPRRVLREILAPPALRRLRTAWAALAEKLVDQVLAERTEFGGLTAQAEAFPLRAFPDAVGLGPDGPRQPPAVTAPWPSTPSAHATTSSRRTHTGWRSCRRG